MFAVIFEVTPRPGRWEAYLAHAASLRPELVAIDGFIDNKRYASQRYPGRLLSLSLWRDEKSVIRWRTHGGHHAAQIAGRQDVFSEYHLRVGEVVQDNGKLLSQSRLDETETGAAKAISLIETPAVEELPAAVMDWDRFDGITEAGASLLTLAWPDMAAMAAWAPRAGAQRLDIRIIRDYGLHDRAEAPQYHTPVAR